MNLCVDYAPRIPGSVAYELRQKKTSGVLRASLFCAAMFVRIVGIVWRLAATSFNCLWNLKRKSIKPQNDVRKAVSGYAVGKALLPLLLLVCGYLSHHHYGMFGVYVYLLSILSLLVLVKAFASGFAEGMQSKPE